MGRPRFFKDGTQCLSFRLDKASIRFLKQLAGDESNISFLLRKIVHEYIDQKIATSFITSHKHED